ncbi:MAG TPA: Ig-like domain-containing protein, partial [Candidatus Sulfotelmatobacter sp.]|nr:Ig-like domain-containing protein [Candidatus Sulfotelmatobacter sp.]
TATSSGYKSATFSETDAVQALTVNAGNNQSGGTGTTLPTALTVLATSNGNAANNVTVTFSDGGAGGTFSNPTVTTTSSGLASTTYTLPPTAQTVTITATSSAYTSATFTETAAVSLSLSPTAGNNQTGNVGTTLPTALTVTATSNGNPASGVSVTFTDNGAGGTFGTPTAITGSNGQASSTYTLPSTARIVNINASASGYPTAAFTETAASQTLSASSGNNQTGNPGSTLPTPLTVLATSNGTPVSGLTVSFTDNGAGGTFGSPTAVTGNNGMASSTYTLPSTAQTVNITVSSSGYSSTSFTETSASSVTAIVVVSGSKQRGTVGTTLPEPLAVRAKNAAGKSVAGASISFSDGGLGGTFSPNPAITASNGEATTSYTLPTKVKTITVTASDGSVSATLTESSLVGPAADFTIVAGNDQVANPDKTLPKKLVVLLTDEYGNPISNATVNFTDNGAGGTFSSTNPVTTSFGEASVSYTTGSTAGAVTITATTGSLTPLEFSETVR